MNENNGARILQKEDVIEIRNRAENGESIKSISNNFLDKVSYAGVYKVVNRISWKHI